MAIAETFKALAVVLADHIVGDTYALLDAVSDAHEVVVAHGVREYDKGYQAGRDAEEAARHPEPLAQWEKELLGTFDLTGLSTEEFAIIFKVIGSHTAGGHPALTTLWSKLQEAASDRTVDVGNIRTNRAGDGLRVDLRVDQRSDQSYHPHHPEDKCWSTCID
jgi:hypothetical protein